MTAPYASIADPTKIEGRRISAWSIDLAIFLALFFGVFFATGGVSWRTQQFDTSRQAIDFCEGFRPPRSNRAAPRSRTRR